MSRAKAPARWFLPWWMHRHLRKRRKFEQVRDRDGDECWRCGHPMRFDGPPNCGKAATIEHVQPRGKGGGWRLDNLRLCHVGCNRHLGDQSPEQKARMRINVRPA